MIVLSIYGRTQGLVDAPPLPVNCQGGTSIRLTDSVRDEAIRTAAAHYGVSPSLILGKRGLRPIQHARQLAVWLLRQKRRPNGDVAYSYPEIGLAMDRDHTSCMNACRQVAKRLAQDEMELMAEIAAQ